MRLTILVLALMLAGCSLPRVTVMDDPLSSQEHLQLGLSYEKQGEYALAKNQYEQAADELPEAWLYLGNLHFTQEEYDAAEKAYTKAIRELPTDPRPRNNLAWMYLTRGEKLVEAETLAQEAVELAPEGGRVEYEDTLNQVREALGR